MLNLSLLLLLVTYVLISPLICRGKFSTYPAPLIFVFWWLRLHISPPYDSGFTIYNLDFVLCICRLQMQKSKQSLSRLSILIMYEYPLLFILQIFNNLYNFIPSYKIRIYKHYGKYYANYRKKEFY